MVVSKEEFPLFQELVGSEVWGLLRKLAREKRELLAQRVLGSQGLDPQEMSDLKGEWRAWGRLIEDVEGLVQRNTNE